MLSRKNARCLNMSNIVALARVTPGEQNARMDGSNTSFASSTAAASSGDRSPAAVRRSALVPRLRGVNGNSLGSRRYREVAMALADDHGGPDALDEPTRVLIRQAAGLTVEAENMQRRIARGEAVDHEDLVRITRVLAMLLHRLGIKKAAKPRPTIQEYLAARDARRAAE